METLLQLNGICDEVRRICREVGKFVRLEQSRLTDSSVESKGLNDFVTYVDKAAESLLVSELTPLIREASFLTEEGTVEQKNSEFMWVIDPIDGTTNFIHGVPLFSISIALLHGRKPVLGVIYDASTNECFHAVDGGDAFVNDKVIKVSNRKLLKDSLLVTGFPYREEGKLDAWMRVFKRMVRETHGVRRLGSAALDLAWVACGRFEAFYEYGLSPWDVAAGVLIVQRAGGVVTDFSGESNAIFAKEILAGNGLVNMELMEVLEDLKKGG